MYQKITIIGNLGSEPELKYLSSGDAVCSFSVATNRKWKDNDGQNQEQVTWFRVSSWGKSGEACNQFLSKGSQVFVEGSIQADPEMGGPRIWDDNDGNPRASFEIRAMQVKFLGGRGETSSTATPQSKATEVVPDEIPF